MGNKVEIKRYKDPSLTGNDAVQDNRASLSADEFFRLPPNQQGDYLLNLSPDQRLALLNDPKISAIYTSSMFDTMISEASTRQAQSKAVASGNQGAKSRQDLAKMGATVKPQGQDITIDEDQGMSIGDMQQRAKASGNRHVADLVSPSTSSSRATGTADAPAPETTEVVIDKTAKDFLVSSTTDFKAISSRHIPELKDIVIQKYRENPSEAYRLLALLPSDVFDLTIEEIAGDGEFEGYDQFKTDFSAQVFQYRDTQAADILNQLEGMSNDQSRSYALARLKNINPELFHQVGTQFLQSQGIEFDDSGFMGHIQTVASETTYVANDYWSNMDLTGLDKRQIRARLMSAPNQDIAKSILEKLEKINSEWHRELKAEYDAFESPKIDLNQVHESRWYSHLEGMTDFETALLEFVKSSKLPQGLDIDRLIAKLPADHALKDALQKYRSANDPVNKDQAIEKIIIGLADFHIQNKDFIDKPEDEKVRIAELLLDKGYGIGIAGREVEQGLVAIESPYTKIEIVYENFVRKLDESLVFNPKLDPAQRSLALEQIAKGLYHDGLRNTDTNVLIGALLESAQKGMLVGDYAVKESGGRFILSKPEINAKKPAAVKLSADSFSQVDRLTRLGAISSAFDNREPSEVALLETQLNAANQNFYHQPLGSGTDDIHRLLTLLKNTGDVISYQSDDGKVNYFKAVDDDGKTEIETLASDSDVVKLAKTIDRFQNRFDTKKLKLLKEEVNHKAQSLAQETEQGIHDGSLDFKDAVKYRVGDGFNIPNNVILDETTPDSNKQIIAVQVAMSILGKNADQKTLDYVAWQFYRIIKDANPGEIQGLTTQNYAQFKNQYSYLNGGVKGSLARLYPGNPQLEGLGATANLYQVEAIRQSQTHNPVDLAAALVDDKSTLNKQRYGVYPAHFRALELGPKYEAELNQLAYELNGVLGKAFDKAQGLKENYESARSALLNADPKDNGVDFEFLREEYAEAKQAYYHSISALDAQRDKLSEAIADGDIDAIAKMLGDEGKVPPSIVKEMERRENAKPNAIEAGLKAFNDVFTPLKSIAGIILPERWNPGSLFDLGSLIATGKKYGDYLNDEERQQQEREQEAQGILSSQTHDFQVDKYQAKVNIQPDSSGIDQMLNGSSQAVKEQASQAGQAQPSSAQQFAQELRQAKNQKEYYRDRNRG